MGAVENIITDNLPIWSSSVQLKSSSGRGTSSKRKLYGVKKLRELILDLAVRGLLVPQNPTDKPASVLLENITAKKEELVGEGKIKTQKPLLPLSLDELPFELPCGWEWVRLQDISTYIQRGKGPKYSDEGSIKVVSQKCVQSTGFDLAPARLITDESLSSYKRERFLLQNDLIWNSTGTGTVGRIAVVPELPLNSVVGDSHVTIIRTVTTNPYFIKSYLSSSLIQERIDPEHENALVSGSTKQVELNTSTVIAIPIPLPPIAEQHRIVAKVDELMTLCDTLEQQQEDSIQAHETLVETLLEALIEAVDADAFQAAWQRISENFDVLFTTEHSIDKLKETVLQLAVMGKLVKQRPNDESANLLLERISAEKKTLVKAGKIKNPKTLPSPTEPECLNPLPSSWKWVRLGEITNYGMTDKIEPHDAEDNTWVLELEDVEKETSKLLARVRFSQRVFKSTKNIFKRGDVIYGKLRPYLDKVLVADEDGVCTTEMIPLRGYLDVNPEYLRLTMKAPQFKRYANNSTHGMSLPRMGTDKARLALIPICALSEQNRIVAKVDELMALCDQLNKSIQQAQKTQIHLTDTVVENAL